jgi:ketosteroid isomerase-like protein
MHGQDVGGRAAVLAWIDRYERAWRSPGTALLDALFTPDASYRTAPFEPPFVGRDAIREMWQAAGGAEDIFTIEREVVAVDGDVAVARLEVRYGEPARQVYRDLWILRFDGLGRCRAFEEWPFWPAGSAGTYERGPSAGLAGG